MSQMRASALVCLAVAGLAVGRAQAASDHTDLGEGNGQASPDLVTPWGVDINALFDYHGYLVTPAGKPPNDPHNTIPAGVLWATAFDGWSTNTGYSCAYLDELKENGVTFHPAGDPITDFESKLVAVTFIIDPGTDQETVFVEDPADITRRVWAADVYTVIADNDPFGVSSVSPDDVPDHIKNIVAVEPTFPTDWFFPDLGPLSVGEHVVEVVWTMSADHWDGITTDPNFSELKAGPNLVGLLKFEVGSHDL